VVLEDTDGVDAEPRAESADEAVAPTTAGTDAVRSDVEVRIDGDDDATAPAMSTPVLVANVVASQGLVGLLLVGLASHWSIPAWAFGLAAEPMVGTALALGGAVGVVFYLLNETVAVAGRRRGGAGSERLRATLAPDSAVGWLLLLVVVLPLVAVVEELLFRGALVGVLAVGSGLSPWLLAVASSAAFALGHGTQGRLGVVVTGLLGFGLAAVFVFTGSLLVVIVAHYVVNVCEFVVHEGLGLEGR
jgi:membrane protease YdiL (CAAX protease family)